MPQDEETHRQQSIRSLRHMIEDLSARDVELVWGLVENMLERQDGDAVLTVEVVELDR